MSLFGGGVSSCCSCSIICDHYSIIELGSSVTVKQRIRTGSFSPSFSPRLSPLRSLLFRHPETPLPTQSQSQRKLNCFSFSISCDGFGTSIFIWRSVRQSALAISIRLRLVKCD
uniref:Uncharacterized protein n=1 Tax=Anguilla anguilla TaxID=7936 RepID=A0A0E9V5V0_ANGAN